MWACNGIDPMLWARRACRGMIFLGLLKNEESKLNANSLNRLANTLFSFEVNPQVDVEFAVA